MNTNAEPNQETTKEVTMTTNLYFITKRSRSHRFGLAKLTGQVRNLLKGRRGKLSLNNVLNEKGSPSLKRKMVTETLLSSETSGLGAV